MYIKLNGENREFQSDKNSLSISKLVEILDLKGFFAVEVNLKIINKEEYNSIFIKDGDNVEIVSFAGGG